MDQLTWARAVDAIRWVGIPGQVDSRAGTVRLAVNLGIDEPYLPLADLVRRLAGLAGPGRERRQGGRIRGLSTGCDAEGEDPGDLAYVSLGTGVAAGFVIDGVDPSRGHRDGRRDRARSRSTGKELSVPLRADQDVSRPWSAGLRSLPPGKHRVEKTRHPLSSQPPLAVMRQQRDWPRSHRPSRHRDPLAGSCLRRRHHRARRRTGGGRRAATGLRCVTLW